MDNNLQGNTHQQFNFLSQLIEIQRTKDVIRESNTNGVYSLCQQQEAQQKTNPNRVSDEEQHQQDT